MRRKITEPSRADVDALPDLTEQQREFVHGILQGKTASDAYRLAYNCENMQNNTIWARASELRSNSKVSVWISAAQKAGLGHAKLTLESHIAELERLREIALETGNVGAAVQAEQLRGKACGQYTDKIDMNLSSDPAVTLEEIIAEIGPDLADALARQTEH